MNTLGASFAYDDKVAVQGNPDVVRPSVPLSSYFLHDFWGNDMWGARAQGGWTHFSWRPLVVLSFRANYWMSRYAAALKTASAGPGGSSAGGVAATGVVALDPRMFHATNVLIHGLAAVAAFGAMRALMGRDRCVTAFVASALFALHPVHTECVANVTSRSDALAAVFQFLALMVHAWGWRGAESVARQQQRGSVAAPLGCADGSSLRAHDRPLIRNTPARFVLVLVLCGVALMCKETSLVLPVLFVVWEALTTGARVMARAAIARRTATTVGATPAQLASVAAAATESVPHRLREMQPLSSSSSSLPSLLGVVWQESPLALCAAYAATAAAAFVARVTLMARGYNLANFANPIHNPLVGLASASAASSLSATILSPAVLSLALVQAFALSQLVLPVFLSHEHQAMAMVYSVTDPRNVFSVVVWASVAAAVLAAVRMAAAGGAAMALRTATTPNFNLKRQQESAGGAVGGAVAGNEKQRMSPASAVAATAVALQHKNGGSGNISGTASSSIAKCATTNGGGADSSSSSSSSRSDEEAEKGDSAASIAAAARTVDSAVLIAFGVLFVAITYAPASHLFVYVAFLVAERTLLFPSFGAVAVLAEMLALWGASGGDTHIYTATNTPNSLTADKEGTSVSQMHNNIPSAEAITMPAKGAGDTRGSLPPLLSTALAALLCAYYATRTLTRNLDWRTEEALLLSNLALYPANNGMSTYGLGAIYLYGGRVREAEALLVSAANMTSLAEPHILLSQLHWRHRPHGAEHGLAVAQAELELIENTTSPRKEVLTNLGLLLYVKAREDWEFTRAEYLILAAHVAHGYPVGHPSIGILASNAGCIRMLSEPRAYGDAALADAAFEESLRVGTGFTGLPSLYRNAAVFAAVQGRRHAAISIVQRGLRWIEAQVEGLRSGSKSVGSAEDVQASLRFYGEHTDAMKLLLLSFRVFAPRIDKWGEEAAAPDGRGGPTVAGAHAAARAVGGEARRRMTMLGAECVLELLWW